MNRVPLVPSPTPTRRRPSGVLLAAAAAAFLALGAPGSFAQSSAAQSGAAQSNMVPSGTVPSAAAQDSAPQSGAVQSSEAQTGVSQNSALPPGAAQSGAAQSGAAESGTAQGSTAPNAPAQPGAAESAAAPDAAAQAAPEALPKDAASLLGRVRTLGFMVKLVTLSDGSRWIRNSVEVETVLLGRLDDLIGLLSDYQDSPKIFSRIASVRVRSTEGDVAVTEQKSVVKALGFQYSSTLVLRNVLTRLSPTSATLSFGMIGSDGSCRSSTGGWRLHAFELGGKSAIHVTYRTDMLVRPDFPMQLQIMQLFAQGDFEHMMRELEKAFAARNAAHSPNS